MSRLTINLGLTPNDGRGDKLRDAFVKVNSNFSELYAMRGVQGAQGPAGPIGGANTQFLYNDNGVVSGSNNVTFNKESGILNIAGAVAFSTGAIIVEGYNGGGPGTIDLVSGENGWASLSSFSANNYVWVDNAGAHIAANAVGVSKVWDFGAVGVTLPQAPSQIGGATQAIIASGGDIAISASANNFRFNADGTLKLPNYTLPYANGTANQILVSDSTGTLTWKPVPIAGSNTQIIFNNTGSANGSANLTYNSAQSSLTLIGTANITSNVVIGGNVAIARPDSVQRGYALDVNGPVLFRSITNPTNNFQSWEYNIGDFFTPGGTTAGIRSASGKYYGSPFSSGSYLQVGFNGVIVAAANSTNQSISGVKVNNFYVSPNIPDAYSSKIFDGSANALSAANTILTGVYTTLGDYSANTIKNTLYGVYTDVGGGNNSTSLRIAGAFLGGNVGIGTSTPTSNLHVIGTANVTSLTVNGTISLKSGANFGDISVDGAGRVLLSSSSTNGARVVGDLQIGSTDTVLVRDSANTLAQRNGTANQTFRVYNSYTDASNYSRLAINSNQIASEVLGTGSLLITADKPVLNLAQTWNNASVAFTATKINVTDTASAAGSKLLDLQVGNASKFYVDKTGAVVAYNGYTAASGSVSTSAGNIGLDSSGSGYYWRAGQTWLYSNASNILDQRNGTANQTFRVYNSYTDASNYSRLAINSNQIASEALGTGSLLITADKPVLNLAQEWSNSSDVFTATKVNVTDSASAASSLLMDLQVGGVSRTKVDKNGLLTASNVLANDYLGCSRVNFTGRTALESLSNIIEQRYGTANQTFRVYNSYTDASNYSRLAINSNQIASEVLGTGSLLITADKPVLNLAQEWSNSSVTFSAAKINVTDTASGASSLLMDLQTGGTPRFGVLKDGAVYSQGSTINKHFSIYSNGGGFACSNFGALLSASSYNAIYGGYGPRFVNDVTIGWSAASTLTAGGGSPDLVISRKGTANLQFGSADAAAPVPQTIGPQSVVAGTTDTAGPNFTIRSSQGTGTGAGGSIIFQTAPAGTTGTAQNALITRLTLTAAGTAAFGGTIVLPSAASVSFTSRGSLGAAADGVFTLSNNASTDFGRLQLGGTTSAFPAIKRSGTTIQARLADDSGDADLQSGSYRLGGNGIITDSTIARTLSSSDNGKMIYFTNSSAITVTTANTLVAGFSCGLIQANTGQITIVAGTGTTVNSFGGLVKTAGQFAMASMFSPAANNFIIAGNLA